MHLLALAAREEDSSRYVRPTSEFEEHPYPGWYYGKIEDYYSLKVNNLITEFGAQALPSVDGMKAMVDETWPPDWKKMSYHDFQHGQTFHVAKIPMGKNWDEFVTNSQAYQAHLLKTGIERFRRAKYAPLGCYFQFMFMDCWPSVTWSVVSYERRPKAGYYVVQQASQPVLAGVDLRRDMWTHYREGNNENWVMKLTPWIVNDLPQSFKNVRLLFLLKNDNILDTELKSLSYSIEADSVATLLGVDLSIPATLPSGKYTLELRLIADGELVSTNTYTITIAVYNAINYKP